MAANGEVATVQEATDSTICNLDNAGRCLKNATQALRDRSVDVAVQGDATYEGFHKRLVHLAGLIYRVNLPIVCNVVRGLSGICDECAVLSLDEYLDQVVDAMMELEKLRKEVSLAYQISLSVTVKAKKLENDLNCEIRKLNKEAAKESLLAETHKQQSEADKASQKNLHTAAWIVGGVGFIALTGGLGSMAFLVSGGAAAAAGATTTVAVVGASGTACGAAAASAATAAAIVSAESVAAGVAIAGAAAGGGGVYLGQRGSAKGREAEETDRLQSQAQDRCDKAKNVEEGMSNSLLGCANWFCSALETVTNLLTSHLDCLKVWKRKAERIFEEDNELNETLKRHYKIIQHCAKEIKGSCSQFLPMAETAMSDVDSLETVEDAAVVEFFQTSSSQIRNQLLDVDPGPFLETLQLQQLEIDGVNLTRGEELLETIQISEHDGPHLEEDNQLIEGGRLMKNVITELVRDQDFSGDFATCEALKLVGLYRACVLEFARALARGLREYCQLLSSLANDMLHMMTALMTDLRLYKERLQLGCALHEHLTQELQEIGLQQDGWEEMFIEVLEITSDCFTGASEALEQIQKKLEDLTGTVRERRRCKLIDSVQKNALGIERSCTTYVRSFADESTGTLPMAFEEFAQTLVVGWLRRHPRQIRVLVQSVGSKQPFRHIFPQGIL